MDKRGDQLKSNEDSKKNSEVRDLKLVFLELFCELKKSPFHISTYLMRISFDWIMRDACSRASGTVISSLIAKRT